VNRIDEPEGQGGERTWASDSAEELEQASENVLEGWPARGPDALEEGAADDGDEGPAEPGAEAEESAALPDESAEEAALVEDAATVDAAVLEVAEEDADLDTSAEHAPGELVVPPGFAVLEGRPHARRRAVGIVVSRFNGEVTGALLESALDELEERGVGPESITVMPVPGAFELPIAAMALAKTRRFACIVALGCVICGDTPHFDYVASEAASGLQLAAIETGVPVAFGVLTLEQADQANDRLEKGAEAVRTGLEMADVFAQLRAAAQR
jgi:6,7-dimethyl-8-ribityllumazine synthase